MILKRGVTGFTAVQAVGGRVIEWFDPDVTNPYPHMHVQVKGKKLYIFYNVMYDYVAFSSSKDLTNLQFLDEPLLVRVFTRPYEVLTVEQLQEPLRKQKKGDGYILLNDNDLNEVELYYMDYFPAQTVGDLVFNYWD